MREERGDSLVALEEVGTIRLGDMQRVLPPELVHGAALLLRQLYGFAVDQKVVLRQIGFEQPREVQRMDQRSDARGGLGEFPVDDTDHGFARSQRDLLVMKVAV